MFTYLTLYSLRYLQVLTKSDLITINFKLENAELWHSNICILLLRQYMMPNQTLTQIFNPLTEIHHMVSDKGSRAPRMSYLLLLYTPHKWTSPSFVRMSRLCPRNPHGTSWSTSHSQCKTCNQMSDCVVSVLPGKLIQWRKYFLYLLLNHQSVPCPWKNFEISHIQFNIFNHIMPLVNITKAAMEILILVTSSFFENIMSIFSIH